MLEALGSQRFHRAHRRQRLLAQGGDLALGGSLLTGGGLQRAAGTSRDDSEGGDDGYDGQRQHGVDEQTHGQHPAEQQQREGDGRDRLAVQLADGVDVTGEAGDEVAGGTAVVVPQRQPLQVGVDGHSQVVHDPFGGAAHSDLGGVGTARLGHRDAHDERANSEKEPGVDGVAGCRRVGQRVDDELERERPGEFGGDDDTGYREGGAERPPPAAGEREQPAERVPRRRHGNASAGRRE
jgi:hypothetical protein